MKNFEAGFGEWVIKRRWWIIIATLAILIGSASGARYLGFSNDAREFFSGDNPRLKTFEALEATYTKIEGVFFLLAPKNGDVFTARNLSAVEELTEASWQIPYSSRVDSITNFQHTRAEGDDLIVEDLARNSSSFSDAKIARIRDIALAEPLLLNRLVSKSGNVTGINVNIIRPAKSITEVPEIAKYAREMADNFRSKHPDIDLYLAGNTMMDNAFGEAGQKDMSTLLPLMFLVIIFIMGVMLRSLWGTVVTVIVIVASAITGFGLAGWVGINISPPLSNAPMIILTLAVADSIHILVTMFHQMRLGKSKLEAISESMRINLQPVFLTSITTAIGFLAMNFSDAPPFHDLGNTVAAGVMAAFIYSIFTLPALLSIFPVRVKAKAKSRRLLMDDFGDFVVSRRRPVFWGMLILIIGFISAVPLNTLDDVWIKYFDKSYEIRRASDFIEANLTGLDVIEYSLESGSAGGINDPQYLKKVEEFSNWYRKQAGVDHVNTITDIFKRLNQNMHGDDKAYYRLPDKRDLAAQYLLLYEMSLPYGLDLNNQINVDKSATRISVTLNGRSSRQIREMDAKAVKWLKANAPKNMQTMGAGLTMMFSYISETNINSMLSGAVLALILISGILLFALRSVKLGLVSLVPNLAPIFMTFGAWGLYMGNIGLGIAIVGPMTLGIVVDDTVHFLSKYTRARRELNMDAVNAVRYSFHSVGSALLITTIILISGFAVLAFSGFKFNSDLGLLTAIGITFALALDFLFLPTLLMKVEEEKYETVNNNINLEPVPVPADSGE